MKKLLSLLLLTVLLLGFMPVFPARAEGKAETVTDEDEFFDALADETVETIRVASWIQFVPGSSMNDALVIDRENPVIIEGTTEEAELTLRYAGIVLGTDVTFKNISVDFANTARNAIIVNGYTLTADGLSRTDSVTVDNHIFLGGITEYLGANGDDLPAAGKSGKLVIRGTGNRLGNIYAGNFSDVPNAQSAVPSAYAASSSIVVESDAAGSVGDVYACGARESRDEGTGNLLYSSSSLYPVEGKVTVQLHGSLIKNVYGLGAAGGCAVSFNTTSQYLTDNVTLEDVSSLSVESGKFAPAAGSSFATADPSVSVSQGAFLGFTNFGSQVSIGNFTGGGTLVMEQNQSISISGTVSGSTSINLGRYETTDSQYLPIEDKVYIAAPLSGVGSFTLVPPLADGTATLTRDSKGNWSYVAMEEELDVSTMIIESISIPAEVNIEAANNGAQIPVDITYKDRKEEHMYCGLSFLPISISLDGAAATAGYGEYGYYYLPGNMRFINYIEFALYDEDEYGVTDEVLLINGSGTLYQIPEGTFSFSITIPGAHMADGEDEILPLTLKVGSGVPLPDPPRGDVNGDDRISVSDAVLTARIAAELDADNGSADMDDDGRVTVLDVLLVCKSIAGIPAL